ncbi:GTPase IMAP family member 7-like [Odontesthes bonariensis]|uniref:GTPase IMAP family member 7-like n=1 Tax=Odontesthes bonariensis TaxID=219752 RepID=UPI003F58E47E
MSGEGSTEDSKLRVVLVGSVGPGKSSVIESILRSSEPNDKPSDVSININVRKCRSYSVKIGGRDLVFFDTPGLCNTELSDKQVMEEIKSCVSTSGRHVFLFVMNMGRFTSENKKMVETVKTALGKKATDYTILLFTHGNVRPEERKPAPKFVAESDDLRGFYEECKGRHVVFHTEEENASQVSELLQLIDDLQNDGGHCYTSEMLKQAESRVGLRAQIALWISTGAVAGAGVVGAVAHFVGGVIGIPVGAAAGAAAGGVLGCVGVVVAQHVREKGPLW